jgi:hypothetical protein
MSGYTVLVISSVLFFAGRIRGGHDDDSPLAFPTVIDENGNMREAQSRYLSPKSLNRWFFADRPVRSPRHGVCGDTYRS